MASESFNLDQVFSDAEGEINRTEENLENDEETDEQEKEKLKKEIREMKEKMDKMKKELDKFKEAAKPGVLKSIIDFVGKTVATGVIFYLVNLALGKIKANIEKSGSGDDKKKNDQQEAKIKALMALQKDQDNLSRVLQTWIVAHQDEQVTLSGIDVPLVDIFNKYLKDMGEVSYREYEHVCVCTHYRPYKVYSWFLRNPIAHVLKSAFGTIII